MARSAALGSIRSSCGALVREAVQTCALEGDMMRGAIALRVVVGLDGLIREVSAAPSSRQRTPTVLACMERVRTATRLEPGGGEVVVADLQAPSSSAANTPSATRGLHEGCAALDPPCARRSSRRSPRPAGVIQRPC